MHPGMRSALINVPLPSSRSRIFLTCHRTWVSFFFRKLKLLELQHN